MLKHKDQANAHQDGVPALTNRFVFRRRWLGLVVAAGLLSIGGWEVLSPNSYRNRSSAIKAALEWACLPPLPEGATNLEVETTGNMFTRTFVIRFSSDTASINAWMSNSYILQGSVAERDSKGWLLYQIKPCKGASSAILAVSPDKTKVRISASWS